MKISYELTPPGVMEVDLCPATWAISGDGQSEATPDAVFPKPISPEPYMSANKAALPGSPDRRITPSARAGRYKPRRRTSSSPERLMPSLQQTCQDIYIREDMPRCRITREFTEWRTPPIRDMSHRCRARTPYSRDHAASPRADSYVQKHICGSFCTLASAVMVSGGFSRWLMRLTSDKFMYALEFAAPNPTPVS